MLYKEFIEELLGRLKITDTPENRIKAGRKINLTYDEVANAYDWECLKCDSELVTVPNYTTGTISFTSGQYTVTGDGTTWTSEMEGRFLNFNGSNNWYKIVAVSSTTQLLLQSPLIEDTSSGLTYTIWKRYYYLPPIVRKILYLSQWFTSGLMGSTTTESMHDAGEIPNTGQPEQFTVVGDNMFKSEYTVTGNSVSFNSNLLTLGASASGNILDGDIVTVGSFEFNVERISGVSQVTLSAYSTADQPSVSVTFKRDVQIGIEFTFQPDSKYIIPYTYIRRVYKMQNEDYDRPKLPKEFDMAILDGAEAMWMKDLDDTKWTQKLQEYIGRVKELKAHKSNTAVKRSRQNSPYIPTRSGY